MSRKPRKEKRKKQRRKEQARRKGGMNTARRVRLPIPPWIENEASLCPCGSGHAFAECCKPHIPVGGKIVNDFSRDDLVAGERAWRGALTKYLGYVFDHTLPILAVGPPGGAMIAQMDVDALEESIDGVAWFLRAQGKASQAIDFFDHLSSSIPLPGLSKRILAIKAVWVEAVLHDHSAAAKLFADIDPMKEVDAPLLEAYVSIVDLPEARRMLVLDRALKYSRKPVSKVFNATSKALSLLLLGDLDGARKTVRDVIEHDSLEMDDGSVLDKHTMARAYNIKWFIEHLDEDRLLAIRWYELIPLGDLTKAGQADVHYCVGCLLGDAGEHNCAINRLEESLTLHVTQPTRIRLAGEYVADGQFNEARRCIAGFEGKPIDESTRVEYHTIDAMLAVHDKNEEALRACIKALQGLNIPSMYYREQRNQICTDFLEVLNREAASWTKPASTNVLLQILSKLARICVYLELKPNVFGLGINLNKVIDDVAKKTHKP